MGELPSVLTSVAEFPIMFFFFFEAAFGKIGFPPGENPTLGNLNFIFANFDNFAAFVDRAVFTLIKDWSEGFPNMVLSTKNGFKLNLRTDFTGNIHITGLDK